MHGDFFKPSYQDITFEITIQPLLNLKI